MSGNNNGIAISSLSKAQQKAVQQWGLDVGAGNVADGRINSKDSPRIREVLGTLTDPKARRMVESIQSYVAPLAEPNPNRQPQGPGVQDILSGKVSPHHLFAHMARAGVLVRFANFDKPRRVFAFDGTGAAAWFSAFRPLQRALVKDPTILDKIHEVSFEPGRRPGVAIETAEDGARTLVLTYSQSVKTYTPKTMSQSPSLSQVGREVREIVMHAPEAQDVHTALASLSAKPEVARFAFDRRFLAFLATRGTVLQVEDPHAKDASGRFHFHQVLAAWGAELEQSPDGFVDLARRLPGGVDEPIFVLRPGRVQEAGIESRDPGWFARDFSGDRYRQRPTVQYRADQAGVSHISLAELNEGAALLDRWIWDRCGEYGRNGRYLEKGWSGRLDDGSWVWTPDK